MPYPFDGESNLRPGAAREVGGLAPYYDPDRSLAELFAEFLDASASIINDAPRATTATTGACSPTG